MEGTLTKKGKYWYVVVDIGKDSNGKRIRKWHNTNCKSKTEAKKVKRRILSSLDDGTYVEPKKISFSEFILEWLEDDIKVNREATTYESYKQTIKKHIVPFFMNIQLQELQPIHVQRFYKHLLDNGLSANTVKHHHANIHKCLKYALRMGLVSRNVSEAVELPKVEKFHGNFYNEQQIVELLKVIKGTYVEVPVMITIAMGLRRGEVLGLKWENVDLSTGEMHIINNRVRKGTAVIDKATKTESSRRILIMPDVLIKYLKKVHANQRINKWTFGSEYNKHNYICCTKDGKPLGVTYVSKVFKDILVKNELPLIRFHDLRHSNATYLLNQGVSLKELQDWLGHSTINVTANIYAHTDIENKKKIATKSNMMFKSAY